MPRPLSHAAAHEAIMMMLSQHVSGTAHCEWVGWREREGCHAPQGGHVALKAGVCQCRNDSLEQASKDVCNSVCACMCVGGL